ncbi:BnaA09g38650D [Brassica napus]|uniref:SKA complex subunit 1 homolog n=1 Tax=Brassica napus TaxID=3708 RepID=A0A078HRF3_BRANA|nr:BnaA09g38650D [Brassica napus]
MEGKQAGSSLDSLISSFNKRVSELQELVIARNIYPASSVPDLTAIDTALSSMELQVQSIKDRLREETEAIPKAKVLVSVSAAAAASMRTVVVRFADADAATDTAAYYIATAGFIGVSRRRCVRTRRQTQLPALTQNKLIEASLKQQGKLQKMSVYAPSHFPDKTTMLNSDINRCLLQENVKKHEQSSALRSLRSEEEAPVLSKERKGRGSPPLWYITVDELNSLSSYMRGRLTLEKVNAAINDMASYAEANAHLISAPKQKLAENLWEKALKLRDIVTSGALKGKHFFLETDMKGPMLKLDNTGKAILTVLRHLGRVSETRIGQNRVIILMKPN